MTVLNGIFVSAVDWFIENQAGSFGRQQSNSQTNTVYDCWDVESYYVGTQSPLFTRNPELANVPSERKLNSVLLPISNCCPDFCPFCHTNAQSFGKRIQQTYETLIKNSKQTSLQTSAEKQLTCEEGLLTIVWLIDRYQQLVEHYTDSCHK